MYPKYWILAHGPKSNIAVAGPNSHTLSHLHHQQLLKSSFVITRFQNKKQTKKWTRGKYPVYYILFPSLTLTFSFYHHCNSVKKYSHRNLTPPHTHTISHFHWAWPPLWPEQTSTDRLSSINGGSPKRQNPNSIRGNSKILVFCFPI